MGWNHQDQLPPGGKRGTERGKNGETFWNKRASDCHTASPNAYLSETHPRSCRGKNIPTPFCGATITVITKARQRYHKKRKLQTTSVNIDTKILKVLILANQIQRHIKRITYCDQIGFIPGMQGFFSILKSINVTQHVTKWKNGNRGF